MKGLRHAGGAVLCVALAAGACSNETHDEPSREGPTAAHDQAEPHAGHATHQKHKEHEEHGEHAHQGLPPGEALSGQSVFQVDSQFTNQHGEAVSLKALEGKIGVLAMVYTHCDHACPRIIADMRRIRGALDHDQLEQVQFVLVSIDPERDTVARLESFGKKTGLTAQGWTLLRGDPADIRELAAVFGVQYRKTSDTDFAHSNLISVLNRKGEIAHQQEGLGVEPAATLAAIRELL